MFISSRHVSRSAGNRTLFSDLSDPKPLIKRLPHHLASLPSHVLYYTRSRRFVKRFFRRFQKKSADPLFSSPRHVLYTKWPVCQAIFGGFFRIFLELLLRRNHFGFYLIVKFSKFNLWSRWFWCCGGRLHSLQYTP